MGKVSSTKPQNPTPVQPPTNTAGAHTNLTYDGCHASKNPVSNDKKPYTSMIACNGMTTMYLSYIRQAHLSRFFRSAYVLGLEESALKLHGSPCRS